ncbi:hypothetical protein [Streptomyces luteogriseus]|uniref:hypothetical protein n=1 Tax=Streptomyces luteogriseus TaxID=68233 RepID=UPI002E306CE2|nr:hypothetical protein [Streptomyces luteogriseus]WTJ27233.1 hypothetical protein OID52_09280 [Streptomyces luteogriseus]
MTTEHPGKTAPPPHRPLSDWIARVRPGAPGRPPAIGPVNDGDERTDARTMPRFHTEPWTRTSLMVERAGERCQALALRAPGGGAVVELDDCGAPIAVSQTGAELIDRLENHWAEPPADQRTVDRLRAEGLALRYFLLHRLARETHAPPALFHSLPWERVDAAARSAAALLHAQPDRPPAPPVPPPDGELRHWFTPAASSLAGPLQVLEAGLRTERAGPWFGREAANLLSGLLSAEPRRLPDATRNALADLARVLGEADRALHHAARQAAARLTGIHPVTLMRRLLDSDFVLRASSGAPRPGRDEPSGRSEFLEHWPVAAVLTVTGNRLLEIEMEIEDHPDPPTRRSTDGPLCQPVTLRPVVQDTDTPSAGQGTRYWMLLHTGAGVLGGFIAVPAPDHTFEVDLDAPPLPLRFLDRVPPGELEASLHANEHITLSEWHRMIDGLAPWHPAHTALAAYASRHG